MDFRTFAEQADFERKEYFSSTRIMSNEGESFVILGTSPTPSMDLLNSMSSMKIQSPINDAGVKANQLMSITSDYSVIASGYQTPEAEADPEPGVPTTLLTSSAESAAESKSFEPKMNNSAYDLLQSARNDDLSVKVESDIKSMANSVADDQKTSKSLFNSINDITLRPPFSLSGSVDGSLAVSYLMGDVSSDALKNTVYSQFPSICPEMAACPEDIVKLQNLISEHQALKTTLKKSYLTMKQMYNNLTKQEEKKMLEDTANKNTIAKLSNEILELKTEINALTEQLKISAEAREKEHHEYVKDLSEKTAQIKNMSAHIQKLEEDQLTSFDIIPKSTETETDQQANTHEYITMIEHKRIVKNLQTQLSELMAKNFELKDMQAQYIDEINCLKVNQVAAEELQRKAQADINFLKASDQERTELFVKFDNERKALTVEKDVLLQQLEVYSKDFKIEQEARLNLVQEKEQLISDLRDLQKRNQELVAGAERVREEHRQTTPTSQSNFTRMETYPKYSCPLCGRVFQRLPSLEEHVNQCLDANRSSSCTIE